MANYVARIDWNEDQYNERWNEMLARMVTVFGLPGHRYQTHLAETHMDFSFNSDQDRLLFLAGWPAYIPKGDLNVEQYRFQSSISDLRPGQPHGSVR